MMDNPGSRSPGTANPNAMIWPHTVKSFDPLTMQASLLQELNENLLYEGDLLGYIASSARFSDFIPLDIATAAAKENAKNDLERLNPDVLVFFMQHLFTHRHTPDGQNGDLRFTVSMPKDNWIWLMETLQIHPKFVESLYYLLGSFSTFTTYSEDGETPEMFHVLVKVPPAGHLEAAFYLRYDIVNKKCVVLVAGNDLKGHLGWLREHLLAMCQNWHPFGLIRTIIGRYFYFLEWQRRQLDHSVIMMERVTGRGAIAYSPGSAEKPKDPEPDDFDLQNMHWIGGNQRNIISAMDFQMRLTAFLEESHRKLARLIHPQQGPDKFEPLPVRDRLLQDLFTTHLSNCRGVLDDSRVIGERAQWQLNAADSIINTLIAKQSQRTANESKSIAFETRRDSTSMKTIAGLTMVYLPSTFIATIFSTTFFGFQNQDNTGSLVINAEIWKFVVVSVAFTVATISVWIYLNSKGVPKFLPQTSDSRGERAAPGDQKRQNKATSKILIDLPQQPGHSTAAEQV